MNTKLGCLFGLMMVAGIGGCGGSDSTKTTTPPVTLTCNANLSASSSTYTVSGSSLTLTTGGQSLTLARLTAGSSSAEPIYGGWQLPTTADTSGLGLSAVGTLDIEPGKVTVSTICSAPGHSVTTAMVTSTATITDTSLVIQQNESDTESF